MAETAVLTARAPAFWRDPAVLVWAILVLATALVWFLGGDQSDGHFATTALILVAFFKIRLVILHFMQIRDAVWPLRLIMEAWVIGVCTIILILYWQGVAHG